MIVDLDRVRKFATIEILRWVERHGKDAKIKILDSTVSSGQIPVLEAAYLIEELTGPSDELTGLINRVSLWYKVIEVRGRKGTNVET